MPLCYQTSTLCDIEKESQSVDIRSIQGILRFLLSDANESQGAGRGRLASLGVLRLSILCL